MMAKLPKTCEHVSEVAASSSYDDSNSQASGADLSSLATNDYSTADGTWGVESGYGLHDDAADDGCGRHSFCKYCDGWCKAEKVKTYLQQTYVSGAARSL